jgi:enoyl-[acyl-carrier protein] reductase III
MTGALAGKKALVTGGSRGIGRAIVLKLAQQGADVVINNLRNAAAAEEVKALAEKEGVRAHIIQADVGRPKAIQAMFQEVAERFGGLDILVHNAALGTFKPLMDIEVFHWNISLDVNARALLLCTQEAARMMEPGRGRIIALSSIGSHRYTPQYGAIGISKAAMEATIRYLAVELAPRGIRVNGVSGGPVDTDALRLHPQYDRLKQEGAARTPGGRLGTPEDLASVVLFLASEGSDWIYGQTIIADGGLDLV